MVLAERFVEAKGKVDYSIALGNRDILEITEVKKDDYFLGIAQNAIQIRSAVEKRKLDIDQPCFGIAVFAYIYILS